ncbi:MAG: hypothetical protein A2481_02730 [Candidatus Yonathbacteria bacterium RIFOXYC2_FULL_47_9]|nr:MAG: hypothetical protein A2481_02730 [Candidatus Yonathbacteria bacterium RIFOXYC2_FULL_47_9]HAT68320.1 hypothetical protein [Candidatus Yonathbacteria bacterium]
MAIFDELKSVAGVLQEAGKIPQYQQILEVQEKLLEMMNHIFALENENRELKQQIKTKEALVFEGNVYWMNDGDKKNGPFCKVCHEKENKMITLDIGSFGLGTSRNQTYYRYHCLVCKNYFK